MSGFTRDPHRYGDTLVYEALQTKWERYHDRCGCGRDWVEAHALPAGFVVVVQGSGWVALTGPGLTEQVDEERLTTNVLWEAVTGTPGTQTWYDSVRQFDGPRTEAPRTEQRAHQLPASRAANCPSCDNQIEIGDPIGKGLLRRYVCSECLDNPPVDAYGNATVIARSEKACPKCGDVIRAGDVVTVAPFGHHVCTQCADQPQLLSNWLTRWSRQQQQKGV